MYDVIMLWWIILGSVAAIAAFVSLIADDIRDVRRRKRRMEWVYDAAGNSYLRPARKPPKQLRRNTRRVM